MKHFKLILRSFWLIPPSFISRIARYAPSSTRGITSQNFRVNDLEVFL